MEFDSERRWVDDSQSSHDTPVGSRVDNDKNLSEKNLERYLFVNGRSEMKPVREGEAMGGNNFGKNNVTPSANDRNNPSQYAGNTNAYLALTEPLEEHPEDSNFKDKNQDGQPDYDKAQPRYTMSNSEPKPEKVERGNGENDRPHKGETFQEGTADNDITNIAGPNEIPDQQKVGEKNYDDEREHIET